MTKRLALATLLLAVPIVAGAFAHLETTGPETRVISWRPAGGPVDPPLPDIDTSNEVQGLTVHEWGTFTSVAGPDGKAIEWLPAGGPTDLPCFVNLAGAGGKAGLPPSGQAGRTARAKIRMETPVLYFYTPKEETLNVKVSFPQGLITEWFPAASMGSKEFGSTGIWKSIESFPRLTSTIEWKNVRVMPGATETYPIDETQSHYYAARRTGSMPLQVGKDFEKFLFYRGIASFEPPISAHVTADGKVEVSNLDSNVIPAVVLFENRGGKIGYRLHKGLSNRPVKLELPKLEGNFSELQLDLEAMLREEGMYPLEARAMVETWKDSWFEQGARIFYIVPSKTVDSLLPLEVAPMPISIARAFVGRVEVFTPATLEEVQTAAKNGDRVTLETYGRFLEPILHDFLQDYRADGQITSIRADYVNAVTACSKKRW